MSDALEVTARISIPRSELIVRATRAGGPGGQHVNSSATRIEVHWNVRHTSALTEEERNRAEARLGSRVDGDGFVRVVAAEHRSQKLNRTAAESRLATLIRRALARPRNRIKTVPPAGARETRLADKRRNAERKKRRRGNEEL